MQVQMIDDPEAVQVLANTTRISVLDAVREPASAAAVARTIGQTRQNANYHLKELERVGLVERVGERRTGSFVETLYRSRSRALVVSPRMTLGGPQRADALASQVSLEQLVKLGEGLVHDAVVLLDRAAFDDETVPSASVEADVRFASETDREAFLNEYLTAVAGLTKKYGSRRGDPYRIVLAAYPATNKEGVRHARRNKPDE